MKEYHIGHIDEWIDDCLTFSGTLDAYSGQEHDNKI